MSPSSTCMLSLSGPYISRDNVCDAPLIRMTITPGVLESGSQMPVVRGGQVGYLYTQTPRAPSLTGPTEK